MNKTTASNLSTQRSNEIRAALQRAQISAAKRALQFGQLLYVTQRGRVVGVDPRRVLQMAGASS